MTARAGVPDELVIGGGRIVTPGGVLEDGWVRVVDGVVEALGTGPPPAAARSWRLDGRWLLPGFIDLHVHGGGGRDFASDPESMVAGASFHLQHGTTSTLLSLVTAPLPDLAAQLDWAAKLTKRAAPGMPRVLGAHLEGPFLSQARCGAQNTEHMRSPDRAVLAELIAAADGALRSITIAPELDGAVDLIDQAAAAGIVAALGHSDATFAEAQAGIAAGASLATHLFNGMRPLHHREPGLVGAALSSGIRCELINDGIHVHPAMTRLVAAIPDRLVLVTDAIAATGAGEGEYSLGGQPVLVRDGQARLRSTGSLAGSTLTTDVALRRAVQVSGLSIEQASAAASGTPADVLGLGDQLGSIAVGHIADLVVLTDELSVADVFLAGERQARR